MDLQALREQTINKIREDLDELTGEQLLRLRAMEAAEEAPRATLIKAIDHKLVELGAAAPAGDGSAQRPSTGSGRTESGAGPDTSAAAPDAGARAADAAPAWQAPDYAGPMTGDQALWRMAHLKGRA